MVGMAPRYRLWCQNSNFITEQPFSVKVLRPRCTLSVRGLPRLGDLVGFPVHRGLLLGHRDLRDRLVTALAHHLGPCVVAEPGARGDEAPDDDVLLEAPQVVGLAADRGLREDPGRLLERRRRDEAV